MYTTESKGFHTSSVKVRYEAAQICLELAAMNLLRYEGIC